jgi:hypothetical protein
VSGAQSPSRIRAPAIPPRLGSPPGPPLRGDPSKQWNPQGGEPIGRRNELGRMMVTHGPRVMLVTGTVTRGLSDVTVPSSTGARAAIRNPDCGREPCRRTWHSHSRPLRTPKRCRSFVAREAVRLRPRRLRLRELPSRPSARAELRAAPNLAGPSPVGQANPNVYILARRTAQ